MILSAADFRNVERLRYIVSAISAWNMGHQWITEGDKKGRTPLHLASIYGYFHAVRFIVEEIIEACHDTDRRKRYINVLDNKGRTSLFHAVAEGRVSIARFLIERDADLESVTNDGHIEPGSTALMACAEKNTVECFNLLMEKGADVLVVRKDGADAAYIAARYGHLKIIQRIAETKEIKEIVNRRTFRGRTALLTAAFHRHLDVCKVLLSKGANLNHQDDDKFTALIYAASEGHYDIVNWLVRKGANVHIKNKFGETALMCANANGHTHITKLLQR